MKNDRIAIRMRALADEYVKWTAEDVDGNLGHRQTRGYAFESMIKSLLEAYDLSPQGSYRPDGEQVDGSFIYHGRVYLLEAKWHGSPIPASELYAFKGKVDGKLAGTLGVFFSMSDYADGAVDALIAGKAVNLIMFNKQDWEYCIDPTYGFVNVLAQKLRYAAERGSPYYPFKADLVRKTKAKTVITEGNLDRVLIEGLIDRLLPDKAKNIAVISADGALNTANLAQYLVDNGEADRVLVLVDDDKAGALAREQINQRLGEKAEVLVAEPYLDIVLKRNIEAQFNTYEAYRMMNYWRRQEVIGNLIKTAPIGPVQSNAVVKRLIKWLKGA